MTSDQQRGMAVGLTGGIACGKSEVGKILAALGAEVCDADALAHRELEPGSTGYTAVVTHFGEGIVRVDGTIDRVVLGARVFDDPEEREALNAILHPPVLKALAEWAEATTAGGKDAVGIVPLLFEVAATEPWDAVLCVVADQDTVMERLAARGWTPEEAGKRMAAQWPIEKKAEHADIVIENNGTLDELNRNTRNAWTRLRQKEKASS